MPELLPFRNFHYKMGRGNPEILKALVCPPYDVISEEEKIAFKKRHPDNICHVILPDNYEAAGKKLNAMISDGTLICEKDRCICIYGIDYARPDTGEKVSRYGFVGLLKLVEIFPAKDGVLPHEMTFKKFIDDRLRIIQETDSNFSPIFTIYNGKHGVAEKIFKKYVNTPPFLQTVDRDGFTHKIWEVWKKKDIEKFKEIVKNNVIIIADGHHRYITALKHSKEGGCKYIMTLFIDFNDSGLIIYTSHREIREISVKTMAEFKDKIKDYFEFKDIENYENLNDLMEKNKGKHVFGFYFQNKFLFLKLKHNISPEKYIQANQSKEWKNLNLPILHEILLTKCFKIDKEHITYVKDVKEGIENVDKGKIQALFVVNPTTLMDVQEITANGEIMPHKSTYFYPKPLSGLVIHKHTNNIE